MKSNYTYIASRRSIILCLSALGLFFMVFAIALFFAYGKSINYQKMIDKGDKAVAELVRLQYDSSGANSGFFLLWYEYIDENGIKYGNRYLLGGRYANREAAETHLGEKIEIYIDSKGNSIPVGQNPGINSNLILAIVFVFLLSADIIGIILLATLKKKKPLIKINNRTKQKE